MCVRLCQSRPRLRVESSPVQVRITNFGPEVQTTLAKVAFLLEIIDFEIQGQN